MDECYRLRTADSADDGERLEGFYDTVFRTEKVGHLARTMFGAMPGLERRNWFIVEELLAATPFREVSGRLEINRYRDRIYIDFTEGSIVGVSHERGARAPDFSCRLREQLFAPLVLGHRSFEEYGRLFPDTGAFGASRGLVETLFPKTRSWIHEQY